MVEKVVRFLLTMVGLTAFGIFARALEAKPEFAKIREMASGLELADSITVDGHKLLNVVRSHQTLLSTPSPPLFLSCCMK